MSIRETIVIRSFIFFGLILGIAVLKSACAPAVAEESTTGVFEAARAARKIASEKLVSAIGAGEFTVLMQHKGDDEPKLWSKAKVHVSFDRGKYHVKLLYERMLMRVSTTDMDGKTTEQIADVKYDDVRIIADENDVYVISFSDRIRPNGCKIEIYSKEQTQFGWSMCGFPWSEPARLWKSLPDIEEISKNSGADAIKFSDAGKGRFLAEYPIDDPFADFTVDRAVGFNVVSSRAFNPKQKTPAQSSKATWKKDHEAWYVAEFVEEFDNRDVEPEKGRFRRSELKYKSFDVNAKVDPDLFTLKSLPIPAGTRVIDRR